jgi:hypothetical protein
MGNWLYNKAPVNIKKWKKYKPFKIKLHYSESCIVLNSWTSILLITWHAEQSYLAILLYNIKLLYFIFLYCILLFPLCWRKILILIAWRSIYGYGMHDVSSHMFGRLDGIRNWTNYQVSTSHTYRIQLCEVNQFLYD